MTSNKPRAGIPRLEWCQQFPWGRLRPSKQLRISISACLQKIIRKSSCETHPDFNLYFFSVGGSISHGFSRFTFSHGDLGPFIPGKPRERSYSAWKPRHIRFETGRLRRPVWWDRTTHTSDVTLNNCVCPTLDHYVSQIPLKMLHPQNPQNPPNPETQILRYKFMIKISIWMCTAIYRGILVSRFRVCSIFSRNCHIFELCSMSHRTCRRPISPDRD